ncbi:MAG: HAD-IA family hydrolase [Clostridia bacterium]|nr:HAD-IA family hydrolase [Clostridia bacterium]
MKYKAVLFDLDGTLLDTLSDLTYSVNLVLTRHGWPTRTEDEVRRFVGNGAAKLMMRSMPDDVDADTANKAIDEYRAVYLENRERSTAPYDGVCDLIDRLHADGRLVGVVSNKYFKSTDALCKKFFPTVDFAFGEMEECSIRRKPYPDMVEKVMEELGVTSDESIFVGDSETDIETAHNAHMKCISVTWGFRDRETLEKAGADYFADSAASFDEILRSAER